MQDKTQPYLRIVLTQSCNLECFFCHNEGEEKNGEILDEELIYVAVKNSLRLGKNKIKLTGGEPLILGRKLVDIVKNITRIGIENDIDLDLGITTNGQYLDYMLEENLSLCEALYNAGLKRINVSLHAIDDETYVKIMFPKSKRYSLSRVLKNLDEARKYFKGENLIKINSVIDKNNLNQIVPLSKYCYEKGFNFVIMKRIPSEKNDNDALSTDEINSYLLEMSSSRTISFQYETMFNSFMIKEGLKYFNVKTKLEANTFIEEKPYIRLHTNGFLSIGLEGFDNNVLKVDYKKAIEEGKDFDVLENMFLVMDDYHRLSKLINLI